MARYMLLAKYDDDLGVGLMSEWNPDDMTAHLDYLRKLNQELIDNGELVEVQALAGPDLAKIVVFGGQGTRWSPTGRTSRSRRCWPGISWSMWSPRHARSRSRRGCRPRRGRGACRCGSGSRCAS